MMTIRVFLADDHAVVRDGLRLLLESQPDITVVGDAANGRQAVQQAQILNPDVLIIDIAMPDLNGIEVTRQIRAHCPTSQVVVLSMHSTEEYAVRAFHAGALGYVLKESVGMDVIDAVRAAYAGRRYISQKIAAIERYISGQLRFVSPLASLSEREREVLQLIVEGKSSALIGAVLALSPKTVETYRCRLMHKLGLDDLPSLVKFAIKHGLIMLE
jgi:DNA-binding NarL/FixJ family response regulator